MFDNIEFLADILGDSWVCWLDEEFEGNNVMYAGDGCDSVTGPDEYWS